MPDFLAKYKSGKTLVPEIKEKDSPQNKARRAALAEWVEAVNEAGGFGQWSWDVAFQPGDIQDVIEKHA